MFRLLRVIIRPSNELIQDSLIPSALWDPVVLTVVGAIVLHQLLDPVELTIVGAIVLRQLL